MSSSWTPQPHFRGVVMHCRYGMQSAAIALCVLLLAACGQSSTPAGNTSASSGEIPAVSAPPAAGDRPAALGSTGAAKDASGLPVMTPRGVNASRLFAEKLSSSDDRMNRLENAVQEMRNDFDAMAPSIVRLVAVEKDIQELIGQLETLVSGSHAAPPVESQGLIPDDIEFPQENPVPAVPAVHGTGADGAPVPLTDELPVMANETAAAAVTPPAPAATPAPPPAPVVQAPPPAASPASGVAVTALRTGEHPGKTRIVLDLSGKTDFTADLDNAEKILVIDLPGASWSAEMTKSFPAASRLVSYEVNKGANGTGSLLVVKLKADAAILYKAAMPGDGGKGSKIVIDIGPGTSASVPTN